MELMEKTVESRVLFEGKIITVRLDKAELPNGRVASREVVEHPGGVAILALDEENNVTLVQQYRYPFHQVLLELPAGKLDAGEDHRPAAIREAVLAPQEMVPAAEAVGRICAAPAVSCPPAVPIVVSGEVIPAQALPLFARYGIGRVAVVKD